MTGQPTIPSDQAKAALQDLETILEYTGEPDEKTIDQGKKIFAKWCSTRGKNGKYYSKTNASWLGWWLEVLAPGPDQKDVPKRQEIPRPSMLCRDGEVFWKHADDNGDALQRYHDHINNCHLCGGITGDAVSKEIQDLAKKMGAKK